jgi:hypothetical protein
MNCTGNCNQGRDPCDCSGNAPDVVVTWFCLVGAIVIVSLIAAGVL